MEARKCFLDRENRNPLSEDAIVVAVLNEKGVKMSEWNKTLPHPLTDAGLAKLVKAGFTSSDDVTTLVGEEAVEELDLSLRDRAVLRKIIAP